MAGRRVARRLPRPLHPAAWWIWALSLATTASLTTNPVLLVMIIAVVAMVVTARRSDAPWARGLRAYLWLAAIIVGVRLLFRILLGSGGGGTLLFTLPSITLPASTGIRIGGPVSLEGLLAATYDGLRLATLIVCVGSAQLLADPKRLLRSAPAGLYQIGTTIVVALTIAPQLVSSIQRVRQARRLRGDDRRGLRALRSLLLPVLEDALDRSILLAAAMDARGYGRVSDLAPATRRWTGTLILGGIGGMCVGIYGLLDASTPMLMGWPLLVTGLVAAGAGLGVAGRRITRTVYRPDRWLAPDRAVAALGVLTVLGALATVGLDPQSLHPLVQPLQWPVLPLPVAGVVLLAALPAFISPPVPSVPGPAQSRVRRTAPSAVTAAVGSGR